MFHYKRKFHLKKQSNFHEINKLKFDNFVRIKVLEKLGSKFRIRPLISDLNLPTLIVDFEINIWKLDENKKIYT